ncbi:serine hydrolase domain-containing protein [Clostridium sardiniense]|uniref:serine hydrolase domain-containing protein n=1 Tax=Clostridium sardiniense TaxID=29369 RepID=UPI00195C7B11|nr:serine hydrolase domain-containing protein [Clostridium sardiniense]MBM7833255.1 CubicO group peptidase (beta-lactamase class C family) [Clostridium sardiniense]
MEKNLNIKLIEDKINNMKEFSGVIRINRAEEVLFEKAYGFADISNDRINNINTRFGIASGAKLLTAISICKLVEQGKLKFDSLLKEYIDCDNFDQNVTVRHLLTHTSGLPDYFYVDFTEITSPMYMLKEPKDFLPLIIRQKSVCKPGEKYQYNNGGYVILAYIVEKVSEIRFVDFVKEHIFNVLEMNSSGYFSMDMLPKNCAYGYEENSDGTLKTNIFSIPIVGGGDGGVFVTANDISKLWDGLLNYKLLNKDITNELLTPQVYVNYDVYYGYGIYIVKRDDGIYKYSIIGGDPGVSFESIVYPNKEIEVTILGNRKFSTYELLMEIENIN